MDHVTTRQIADFLGADLEGDTFEIKFISSLDNPKEYSMAFSTKLLKEVPDCEYLLLICPKGNAQNIAAADRRHALIESDNPRLQFAIVCNNYFNKRKIHGIHKTALVSGSAEIGLNVTIGPYSIVGDNVKIGSDTVINSHVVIFDNVTIGKNCYVKSGAKIGEEGFGFEKDLHNDTHVKMPHIGGVVIGNFVEIGANTTIAAGTINSTLIANQVKIDDQVSIAHNCRIGQRTLITAQSQISGSVIIGDDCWIGPNSSIIQKVSIGNDCLIGIGSVINTDIPSGKKFMGLEAMELRELVRFKSNRRKN